MDVPNTSDATDALIAMKEYAYEYNEHTYEYDIHEKKLVNNCDFYPSSTTKSSFPWLHAMNNKYAYEDVDGEKVGRWMLFARSEHIDPMWDILKTAVTNGELWRVDVSTYDPVQSRQSHIINVYTKDYRDLDDIVKVLDFLDSSGLKPPNQRISYKFDHRTSAGFLSEHRSLYSSNNIRDLAVIQSIESAARQS